jgi:hypothetical protein
MATPQIADIFLEREFPITLGVVFQAKKKPEDRGRKTEDRGRKTDDR